jgi:hypothetical protein
VIEIRYVLAAKRESKRIDFKERFDTQAGGEWCEIIKDIIAIANSGGGAILFGADNRGKPTGENVSAVLALDPAVVTDKIHSYTETQFADFEITEAHKAKRVVAALVVGAATIPIVFTRAGTYPVEGGRQKTAFAKGTVYFRHGAKSEPASRDDLADAIERRLSEVRKQWIGGVRKVIESPAGSRVAVLPPEIRPSDDPSAVPIRIVDDESAQAFRLLDIDKTHPYRQKELLDEVRKKLPKNASFNQFDVLVLRKVHPILETPAYSHQPRFGSRQYSKRAVDWITSHYRSDRALFTRARNQYRTAD